MCKINFTYEIRIPVFQLLYFYVEIRITHCYTIIEFTECSYENVGIVFAVWKVDIFSFPFATAY